MCNDLQAESSGWMSKSPLAGGRGAGILWRPHCRPYSLFFSTNSTSFVGGRHNIPLPCKLTFNPLILKVVSETRVTWSTSMPILVFLGLSVLELSPMYASDVRQTDRRQTSDIRQTKTSLNASALWERRHNSMNAHYTNLR